MDTAGQSMSEWDSRAEQADAGDERVQHRIKACVFVCVLKPLCILADFC